MLKNNNLISSSIRKSLQDMELESFKRPKCITETPFSTKRVLRDLSA